MVMQETKILKKLKLATDDGQASVVLASRLENEWLCDRSEATAAMREWQRHDWGRMVLGRRGHDTRFLLGAKGKAAVRDYADSSSIANAPGVESPPSVGNPPNDPVTHTFQLRPGLEVEFSLPLDISEREAARLSRFIEALPM